MLPTFDYCTVTTTQPLQTFEGYQPSSVANLRELQNFESYKPLRLTNQRELQLLVRGTGLLSKLVNETVGNTSTIQQGRVNRHLDPLEVTELFQPHSRFDSRYLSEM